MSVLNQPSLSQSNLVKRSARRVEFLTRALTDEMINSWHSGWDLIWDNTNPQDVLNELGENGAEVFELSEKTIAFLSDVLSGKRQEELNQILSKAAAKPETSIDENGNVTINQQ